MTPQQAMPELPLPFYFVTMAADSRVIHTPYHSDYQMREYAQQYAESLRSELEAARAALAHIADADIRKWEQGYQTTDEFMTWAQSRARAALSNHTPTKEQSNG